MQTTLKSEISFEGLGLHSGSRASLRLLPAPAGHGVVFYRTDLGDDFGSDDAAIPARWDLAEHTALCTKLVNEAGVSVSTVEHLMAAICGAGLHNVRIEINGAELPIMDGSALPFLKKIVETGLETVDMPVRAIRILRVIEVSQAGSYARLRPSKLPEMAFEIDFDDGAIGHQQHEITLENGSFARELSDSRTFCSQSDVDMMRRNGLALGGNPGVNAVVFDGDEVVSPGGLRREDEPVRHKMLDAVGDLALAGAPIIGRYEGVRAGHTLTNKLLRALFSEPDAYEIITCNPEVEAHLPGVGLVRNELPNVA